MRDRERGGSGKIGDQTSGDTNTSTGSSKEEEEADIYVEDEMQRK